MQSIGLVAGQLKATRDQTEVGLKEDYGQRDGELTPGRPEADSRTNRVSGSG